jgi:hypothetical protein
MKVVLNSILDEINEAKVKADLANRTIKQIEISRGEAIEFKKEIFDLMGPCGLAILGGAFSPMPFEGVIGQYNDVELCIVKS